MPLVFSYVSTKAFELFKGKMQDQAADKSKTMINNLSEKVIHKKIFKEQPTYLTVDQFNELIAKQTRELNTLVSDEISKYLEKNQVNSFMTGMTTSINNSLEKALSQQDEYEKLVLDSESKIQSFATNSNLEWKEFSNDQISLLHALDPEKIKIALLDLKNNLEIIQNELLEIRKELKQEHIETREVIKQQSDTFINYFDKIEQYLQNIVSIQMERNISSNSLQTQYHSVFNSLIICPNCGKTTTSDKVTGDNWKCPDCNYLVSDLSSKNKRLSESTLIALSIYNQAITIKNSRGDIQFQAKSYVPRVEVENAFEKFLEDNEKNPVKKLFLLLGEPGVGKTWAAAALSNKYTHTIPVFYFQLRFRDTEEQLKSIFLDNPKLYDFNSVILKIKEFLNENKIMKIFFVFDGFDELYDEIDQRWFFYKLLEPLSKINRILICITSRKYDWNENSFRLKESQFIDEISWKKEGINLATYSDDEYSKIMVSLTTVAPISTWEEQWNKELKRPFLHAIVKRLALELSNKPTFITVVHPSLFELFEYRLQITKDDHPSIVKFAEAHLNGKILTRDDPEIGNSQTSISKLLSSGIIKEQELGESRTRWFAPLIISDPFEETYCYYVMFMSLRLRPKDFFKVWNEFITSEKINNRTKYWIELIVNNTPELSKILTIESLEPSIEPKPEEKTINLNIEITKEIGALIQIYKKRQISVLRLSQRIERDYNEILKTIEQLLLIGKIKGKIDNKSTIDVREDILDLAKDWHVEEELWIAQKKIITDKYDVFVKQFNDIRTQISIGDITEVKINDDFEKIKILLDSLGNLKLSLNDVNQEDYITNVNEEIKTFIESNNEIINKISQDIENLSSEWEKNKENLDNQLLFELNAIETSIQKYNLDIQSYGNYLFSFQDRELKTIFIANQITKVLKNIEGVSVNYSNFEQKLNRINGQLLLKVRDKKSSLEIKLKESQNIITKLRSISNNLLTKFENFKNEQLNELVLYEGKNICIFELNVIKDLNSMIGISLEPVYSIKWNTIGFVLNEQNKIVSLSLCNLNISSLPDSMSNLTNLKVLNIRKNAFKEIPEIFSSIQNLEKLYIEQNQVKDISNIYLLSNLIELHIYQNQIEKIPETIDQLRNLRYLNFNSNLITNIPENISLIKNLDVLDLYNNKLSVVPSNLKNLTNLKQLFLGKNNLTEEEISKFSNLKKNELFDGQ